MVSIKPSFPPTWTPDDEVNECHRCGTAFTMLNRKHHCRACGKIFCGDCSAHMGSIPSYIHRVGHMHGKGLRLCSQCNMLIIEKKKSKNFILIFSLLPLTIKELEVLLFINKEWNTAITSVIGMYKSIQYKSGYKKWSGLERRLICTHWREFVGHNRLMIQSFKGMIGIKPLEDFVRHFKCGKRKYSCEELYCDQNLCRRSFTPYDLLELLYNQHTQQLLDCQELESWIGISLTTIHINWVIRFLPWILQMGKTPPCQRIITNNIIPLALDDINMTYLLYFECEMLSHNHDLKGYYLAIQSRLLSAVDEDTKINIRRSHRLLNIFDDPAKIKRQEIDVRDVLLPYEPNTVLKGIDHKNIRQIMSNTRPWVIPIYTNRGYLEILQKTDDLRKDRMVITVMEFLKVIDKRLTFHTYHVFPINYNKGWIEMIPNSKTVYDIQKNNTIQNYIISFNKNMRSFDLRQKFMYSCTSNCILGYMLGLGDRNLHNILICGETATIANIDFSYLLGYDPKNIESTEMKITSGMVDMLGGYHSDEFMTLKTTCSNIYSNVRRHTYFWYSLFRYLAVAQPHIHPHAGDIATIQKHVDLRLMPNATDEEVKVAIVKSVDSNSDSWKSSISDMAHAVKTNISGLIFNMEL